jgi:heat shock protein HtpX
VDLFEQQRSNRRRTWIVMAVFIAFLAFLGWGFDRFYLGVEGVGLPIGSVFAIGVGSISALASYFMGDRAVLLSTGAVPLEHAAQSADPEHRLEYRQLDNIVEEMAIASGLPKPKIYIVNDADPNAFATGRDPAHASIAVTSGLLPLLNREEMQAVIAHELSHVRNYDIRLMTVIAALVGAVALLADWAARGMQFGGGRAARRDRDKNGGGGALGRVWLVVWLIAIVLAPLIGQLLAMSVSRRREYLADASGAELTRNPLALAGALHKIEFAEAPTKSIHRGSAHLCIADPLGRKMGLREGRTADFFASHPPMASRIAALREMAYQPSGPGAVPAADRQ